MNDNRSPHTDPSDEPSRLPRREFLLRTAMASASALLLPAYLRAGNGGACIPTSDDVLGPYYKANAPFRVALAGPNEPGERLLISGTVYARDCSTPVAGAVVDVWAANDQGCYDNLVECTPPSDDPFNLRGRIQTGENGGYSFSTVKPGRYLNGSTYRPSHVHFRVTAPGVAPLVTQLYFEGDPFIPVDPFASEPDAAPRIIPLTTTTQGLTGVFDIILDVAPGTSGIPYGVDASTCRLTGSRPNPFGGSTMIEYEVGGQALVQLAIHDALGRKVRTLVHSVHGAGAYDEEWDGRDDSGAELPSGMYGCRFQAGTHVETMKLMRVVSGQ